MTSLKLIFGLALAAQCLSFSTASAENSSNDLFDGIYDAKVNCIIVYEKVPATEPNLYISCDGDRMFADKAPAYKDLVDKADYISDLRINFNRVVNSKGTKNCTEYSDDGVWWSYCSSK